MRLGSLAYPKTAAQAPSAISQIAGAANRRSEQAQYGSQTVPGYVGRTPPATSGGSLFVGALSDLFGEAGGMFSVALPWLAPALKNATGGEVDLMKPVQLGYGGSPSAMAESAQVNSAMMAQQFAENGRLVQRIADEVGGSIDHLPGAIKDFLPAEFNGQNVKAYLQGMDPQTLGKIYSQFAPVFPQVTKALSQLDPSFISDFTPFIQQTMMQNRGRFDQELFNANVNQFKDWYGRGAFSGGSQPIPAQLAASSMQFARERLGNQANMGHAINIARAADAVQSNGLAADWGSAMQLANLLGQRSNYAADPSQLIGSVQQLGTLAREGMINPQEIAQAAQVAQQQGMDPMAAMSIVARAGQFRTQHGANAADKFMGDASGAYAQLGQSPWAAALEQAVAVDPRYKRRFESAKQRGDVNRIRQLGQHALQNNKLMRDIGGPEALAGGGNKLLGELSQANPQFMQGLMAAELQTTMKSAPRSVQRKLRRALTRKPDDLMRMYSTGDFTGLRDRRLGAMLSQNPQLAASALSVNPELLQRGSFRVKRRLPKVAPQLPGKQLPQLGFKGPSANQVSPADYRNGIGAPAT